MAGGSYGWAAGVGAWVYIVSRRDEAEVTVGTRGRGSMNRNWIVAASVALLMTTGCADSVAVEACNDFVDAFADRAAACGFDRAANAQAVEDSATMNLGCGAADEVRDPTSFYDGCIPFVEALTCSELDDTSLTLPESCVGQLLFVR